MGVFCFYGLSCLREFSILGREMENVVVTGMGCVSSLGNFPDELWRNLLAGKSGVAPIQRFDASGFTSQMASEVRDFPPNEFCTKRDQSRFSRYVTYAIFAAQQALRNAKVDPAAENPARSGVVIGSSIGGMGHYYNASVTLSTRGPSRVSPFFIPMAIVNMASGEVCNRLGWMGPSYSITSACATSNHSISSAVDQIRLGRADIMLAGGADETVNPLGLAGFASMHAVSRRNDSPETASRPFDIDRDGFVIGEGAGVLVLESESHAKARGAEILARVAGTGLSADAHHISAPREDGEGVALAMQNALLDAGIQPQDVGYINTHGTSTPLGDVAECLAIEKVFGSGIKINSTKSMLGHCLGAAGALEAVATIYSLRNQMLHATRNVFNKDPAIHLDVCENGPCSHQFDYALSNSFGFGGQNCSVIFGRN